MAKKSGSTPADKKKKVTRKARVTKSASKKNSKAQPKKPRRSGGAKASKKQAATAERILEESRRRFENSDVSSTAPEKTAEELVPVYYSFKFTTAWQGFVTTADELKWERERRLYGIIKMSQRFTVHESQQSRLIVKRPLSGVWTTITHVYIEFSDNARKVPISALGKYTDPMHLLDELGL